MIGPPPARSFCPNQPPSPGKPRRRSQIVRAIVESDTGWAAYPTLSQAETTGVALAKRAGAPDDAFQGEYELPDGRSVTVRLVRATGAGGAPA